MKKRVLVTGANGHIGANLVRDLLEHGYEVDALVRAGSSERGLDALPVRIVRGDVLDADAVRVAMEGCAIVFHLAAPYVLWARDPESIVRPAVVGTENVIRCAKERGVERVVVTGSCNAVGFTRGAPLDERTVRASASSPYVRAKLAQERAGARLAAELGVDVVTVLPTAVLGPHDYRRTPTTAPFVDALSGKGPVPFAMNLVDARDVASGHRLAAERGRRGERYLLGGDNVDVPALAALIHEHTGKHPKQGLPPAWVLRIVGALSERISAVSGRPPVITGAMLDDVAGGAPLFDISKARAELGYSPRGAADVVGATAVWAREMRWL